MSVSLVVKVNMVMFGLNLNHMKQERYRICQQVVGGVIPKEYIPAVDKGIQDAMNNGILAGYQVVDVKATLYDGSYHDVDSRKWHLKLLVLWRSKML